ncbi:hypothetical protein RND81_13G053400 [Saponaria officinalis]|uniref:Uncharacterized protein n=1 Tax=Saponaria officinalis TaxID=3572 RepID=A0AAW1GUG2_SAPOF
MQTMHYNFQQTEFPPKLNSLHKFQLKEQDFQFFLEKNIKNIPKTTNSVESEPTSTLDTPRRSSSPPTSTSTLSSAVAAAHGGGGGGGSEVELEELECLFPNENGSLLPWIMGDPVDPGSGPKNLFQSGNPFVVAENHEHFHPLKNNDKFDGGVGGGGLILPNFVSTNDFDLNPDELQFPHRFDVVGDKPQIFDPQLLINQQQTNFITNPSFLISPATSGNYNPGVVFEVGQNPFCDSGYHTGLPPQRLKDELFKVAETIQHGNFSLAQEILARLNHQLSVLAKSPYIRAALLAKEALQMLLQMNKPTSRTLTPYEVVHKMTAYKVFSEVSPITQFVNFTSTQTILDAVDDTDHAIHIVDFDISCGAQWASLIHELPSRKRGSPAPSLRITAIVPPTTHSFELSLIRENLVQFANDSCVAFQFRVVNLDSFDTSSSSLLDFSTSDDECVAVSIPIWSFSTCPSILPSILQFVKARSPKIVVSFDKGFDRYDVPFPQHLIHSLESCTNLLSSFDGLNLSSEIVSKVEKYLIQPRIENSVLGRLHVPNTMPHWKNLFASSGLVPLQFSNFTETQADYVVKRSPGRGFHVEKRQASLVLSWQRRELVAASAWRC